MFFVKIGNLLQKILKLSRELSGIILREVKGQTSHYIDANQFHIILTTITIINKRFSILLTAQFAYLTELGRCVRKALRKRCQSNILGQLVREQIKLLLHNIKYRHVDSDLKYYFQTYLQHGRLQTRSVNEAKREMPNFNSYEIIVRNGAFAPREQMLYFSK